MVTTRKNTRASSGPNEDTNPATSPKEQAPKKVASASASPAKSKSKAIAGHKRKTGELAPEPSKEAGKTTKYAKRAILGEEAKGAEAGVHDLRQTTLDRGLNRKKPQKEEEEDTGVGEGVNDKETVESAEDAEKESKRQGDKSEEQLKFESKSAVSVSSVREEKVKNSPIMEKGVIYFFFRPKVAVEHAESLNDVQRSYIVLRPLPLGAKLKDGKVQDEGFNRLIVVPKKKLPSKGYEKFLTFVEEPKISIADLKSRFLEGSTYMTKTQGERKNSAMKPIGEGIYSLTRGENEQSSHLAYILTLPSTPEELQGEFGLKERGSFIINVRNPKMPAPPQAGIPDPAEYPEDIMGEFRGLKWGTLHPKHLNYKHAEVLFIGENRVPKEGEHGATNEEMEELEDEDEERVKHLNGNEAVFADLELDRKGFVGIESTW